MYKELNGFETPWKGESTTFLQRVIYSLYKKYVNEPFIPKGAKFLLRKYPSIFYDKLPEKKSSIRTIIITGYKGCNVARDETYISDEFHNIELI